MGFENIEAFALKERISSGKPCNLLDVRSPARISNHLQGAINIPMAHLSEVAVRSKFGSSGDNIYVVCHSGGRSRKACEQLAASGLKVINVQGGTVACMAAGMACEKQAGGAISIERQVRIVAGSLVLVGVLLGLLVHPYFYGLSAFVGAGLAFAGVTDTCAMGLCLAMMPWNQIREQSQKQ